MQKSKVRGTLLMSLLSLIMCVAMLVGSTFAWFTDTASTSVNKIQAGKLDIDLEVYENDQWISAEGKMLSFRKAAGAENQIVLWEPGCTYELPPLRVVNKGNLAVKYKIEITGINGDAKLNEVIDWTIGDKPINFEIETLAAKAEGSQFVIKGHMQETAGNEYQGLSINGITISVAATQAASEQDSFSDKYDENAELPKLAVPVSNAAELTSVIGKVADGGTVLLSGALDLGNTDFTIDKNVTLAFADGSTVKNGTIKIAKDKDVTIENVKMEGVTSVYAVDDGTVRFKDCHFAVTPKKVGNFSRASSLIGENQYKTLNIEIDNCVFDYVYDSSVTNGDLWTNAVFTWSSVKECSITNSTFTGYGFVAVKLMNVAEGANIVFEGNTFNMCDASAANNWYNNAIQFIPQHDNTCTVTVKDNVFTGAYEDDKYVFYSEKMSSNGASLANMTLIHSGNTINGVACTDDNFRK